MALELVKRIVDPQFSVLSSFVYGGHRGTLIDLTTGEIVADRENQLTMKRLMELWDQRCYEGHKIIYEHYERLSPEKEKVTNKGYHKYSGGKRVW